MKTSKEVLSNYGLTEDILKLVFDRVAIWVKAKGISIIYTDLENIIETDIYSENHSEDDSEMKHNMYLIQRNLKSSKKPVDKHHETCVSDGATVWLHHDINDVGGVAGRLYDLLHVACGHLYQWSVDEKSNLDFYGENAWKVGSTFYRDAPRNIIKEIVWKYEEEASRIALSHLNSILSSCNLTNEIRHNIALFYNDYMVTDLHYITEYYETGIVKNIYDEWKLNSNQLSPININFPINIRSRSNKCVALINVR